ncbi:serine/threonine-protein kinase [Micromonospora sp. NPDC002717]|uniref:serine/threonine-protein kinase n=1 Tax=Micromonospora sp. NPDC002717 TaxID=3154424 RepID=UPI00332F2BF5
MTGLAGAPVPGLTPLWTHDPVTAGPYRLVGRLGAGGQGVVYLGEDDQGHRVAVKMINIDLRDPRARSQFTKEIAAARRVAPFCTAQVLFAEVDGEPPYVVSEFIEGPTLHRHVREHGTVNGNALHRLAVGTATALAAIHRSDVVHCDLKPDNVVLGRDGPRVIDFGIARALGVTETVTSRVMGTTAYMAPERFRNDAVAPPCDVFAWAATIAFAASGRPPFGNDSLFAVMHRVLNDPPDLPPLPPGLEELIRECLAKEPADRPAAEQVLIRLLGQDVRVSGRVRQENLLQMGNDTAGAPTTNEPLPTSATPQAEPTRVAPRQARPTPPDQPPPSTSDAPAASSRPVEGWGRRLRRESVEPWGVSTAIVLGSGGAAAGYVASSTVGVAAAMGTATFVVVYLVRLLVATALGGGASDRL